MKIKTNAFARRHTPESAFSHFNGTFEELEALVTAYIGDARPGPRPGVLLVTMPNDADFYSGVVVVENSTTLVATFTARREGEEPFIEVRAKSPKDEAVVTEIVLYSRELLAEEGEVTDADFEIVSINARTSVYPEPMTPMAMARNMLGLAGGTSAKYTAEEFAVSIYYWSSRVMCVPESGS